MSRNGGTCALRRFVGVLCCSLLMTLVIAPAMARAQGIDTTAIDAYLRAIQQTDTSARLAQLERFVSTTPVSSLRVDALEWIVWDEHQTRNEAAAVNWARELLKADADNPVGLAITSDAERQSAQAQAPRYPVFEEMAKRGLANLGRFRRPEGMSYSEFMQMRQYAEGALNGAAGAGALQRKDYAAARLRLQKAVTAAPDNPELVYNLALADLSGDNPDRQQGYWMLARAVNLSRPSSSAREIQQYARNRYRQEGGSDADWEQFLTATAAPGANAAIEIASSREAAVTARAGSAKSSAATVAKTSRRTPRRTATASKRPAETTETKVSRKHTGDYGGVGIPKESKPSPEMEAAASLPPISPADRRTGPAVSLGILLETSLTGKQTRSAIVNSLSDLVRRLGNDDEAFILSFSHDLVFEQDLTGDSHQLEQALDTIKPHAGTALLDAAGFAAGHLARIAKNSHRILLVVSDGENSSSRIPALASSREIRASGVKIYCIGVDVHGNDDRYRLEALASGTGGTASFISAPDQFRAAAQQVAENLGIHFQF